MGGLSPSSMHPSEVDGTQPGESSGTPGKATSTSGDTAAACWVTSSPTTTSRSPSCGTRPLADPCCSPTATLQRPLPRPSSPQALSVVNSGSVSVAVPSSWQHGDRACREHLHRVAVEAFLRLRRAQLRRDGGHRRSQSAHDRVGKLVYLDAANPRNRRSLIDVAGPCVRPPTLEVIKGSPTRDPAQRRHRAPIRDRARSCPLRSIRRCTRGRDNRT